MQDDAQALLHTKSRSSRTSKKEKPSRPQSVPLKSDSSVQTKRRSLKARSDSPDSPTSATSGPMSESSDTIQPSRPKSTYIPQAASKGLVVTATPEAVKRSSVHKLSHVVLDHYLHSVPTNDSLSSAVTSPLTPNFDLSVKEPRNIKPTANFSVKDLTELQQAANDHMAALASRNNFQSSGVMLQANLHDANRRSKRLSQRGLRDQAVPIAEEATEGKKARPQSSASLSFLSGRPKSSGQGLDDEMPMGMDAPLQPLKMPNRPWTSHHKGSQTSNSDTAIDDSRNASQRRASHRLSGTQAYQPTTGNLSTSDESSTTANKKKQLAMRQKAVDEAKKSETTTNRGWKDRLRSKSNNDLLQSAASAHDSRPGTSHLDRLGTGLSRLGSTARDETENRKSIKDSSGTGSRRNTLKHPASTGTLIPDVRRMTGADLSGSMTPESLAFLERQETILKRKTLEEAAASVQQLQHRKSQLEVLAPGPGSNISRPRTPRLSGTPGATLTPKRDVTPVRRGSETPSLAAVNAAGGGGAGSQLQQPAPVAAPLKKGENRLSVNTYARYGASGNGFDFNGFQQRPADGDEDRVRRQLEREKERAEAYLERRRMREEGLRLADEEDVTAFPEMREKVGGEGEGERVKVKKSRGCCGLW